MFATGLFYIIGYFATGNLQLAVFALVRGNGTISDLPKHHKRLIIMRPQAAVQLDVESFA
jgi:hypothetical protein